jgi:hypothetical protein
MPALLKALQRPTEASEKTALRLTGCDWWGRRCGWRGLRGGSSPPEEISEAASDRARTEIELSRGRPFRSPERRPRDLLSTGARLSST